MGNLKLPGWEQAEKVQSNRREPQPDLILGCGSRGKAPPKPSSVLSAKP